VRNPSARAFKKIDFCTLRALGFFSPSLQRRFSVSEKGLEKFVEQQIKAHFFLVRLDAVHFKNEITVFVAEIMTDAAR
jgi:hypothetical protein